MTEEEMRDAKVPWLTTIEELVAYIQEISANKKDYGTCVYMMSMAATATLQYMGHVVGASGFQGSCADLDIVRRSRLIEGPFSIINYTDVLYPQYSDMFAAHVISKTSAEWIRQTAEERLEINKEAHPDVIKHWQRLSTGWLPDGIRVKEER